MTELAICGCVMCQGYRGELQVLSTAELDARRIAAELAHQAALDFDRGTEIVWPERAPERGPSR